MAHMLDVSELPQSIHGLNFLRVGERHRLDLGRALGICWKRQREYGTDLQPSWFLRRSTIAAGA